MLFVRNCNYIFQDKINPLEFTVFGVITMILFVYLYSRVVVRDSYINLALLCVIGGGLINIAQRALTGCVADYFNFFGLFVFNIQDAIITCGILYLVYRLFSYNES